MTTDNAPAAEFECANTRSDEGNENQTNLQEGTDLRMSVSPDLNPTTEPIPSQWSNPDGSGCERSLGETDPLAEALSRAAATAHDSTQRSADAEVED